MSIYKRINRTLVIVIAITFFAIIHQNSAFGQPELVPPANDSFENAAPISNSSGYLEGNNANASVEPDEPLFYKGGQTVWYRWISKDRISVTFDLKQVGDSSAGISIFSGDSIYNLKTIGYGKHFDRVTFSAFDDVPYWIQISSKSIKAGQFALMWSVNAAESWKQFDFDGPAQLSGQPASGKSDFAIHRYWTLSQPTGQWWVWLGNTQTSSVYAFGPHAIMTANFAPGDYDGDGKVDIAFYQQTSGQFWIYQSGAGIPITIAWGLPGDRPVQGDFDGDDIADVTVWRSATGTFWVIKSSDGESLAVQWGLLNDKPVVADYDGDGITDFAVKRGFGDKPAYFYIRASSTGEVIVTQFGYGNDMTVPGDYDGDGKNDLAVFRPGNSTFYYLASSSGFARIVTLPIAFVYGDRLVPGDYFGSSRSDVCIWKFRTGDYNCFADGGTGEYSLFHFGLEGDEPVGFSNVH